MEQYGECQQDDGAQAWWESVDAVNEVDGVDDEQDGKNSYRVADPQWNLIYAEDTVEIVYHEVAEREKQCGDKLNDKFVLGLDTFEVINDANKVNHKCACYHEKSRDSYLKILLETTIHDRQCDGHTNAHGRQE